MVVLQNRVATFCWVSLVIMLTFSHVAHASKQPNLRQRVENLLAGSGHIPMPHLQSQFSPIQQLG